ncbi:penicillin acylase family protein [Pseudomonas sp. DTU_2021_1001937_2_SI_NGA_ILE_001]|uniref:penicillin acylase family protein n=1 Tax=Pseudomonas sp. DTU_2021_1001937_2_SI_NGA_ILE_001 TaxID=3077589 RepID=UPI0028FC21C8|nr:penicillin acylase family protein [Pseudomonas sp. DTU_2021_1001937_2_SI_NGA_ILE_001]WNW12881.1 penicillin acylase family protein [Pseudomonas sp. DTU_2021_1001937_2_SI_NGA_ILE_001]
MKRRLTVLATTIALLAAAAAAWYIHGKQPQRDGELALAGLQAPVTVRYDLRGVPHIQAANEADLYRALGYVQAQDRLFQMEMLRRLARGELAEVLGPRLLDTDRLFRTLRIAEHADAYVARQDRSTPTWQALEAYLDGVNQYQASRPAPMEFDLLGIPKRPFSAADTLSIGGYLAYSFAAAFRTEPLLTYVRDELGADYLKVFDLGWHAEGMLGKRPALAQADWQGLGTLARLSHQALQDAGLPQFEGSNAWAIAGSRTRSGKPLLAGDPHIRFSVPAVWYEAQLSAPGFELYGHYQALNPFAFLGHNRAFGWSLTMFQNDDLDLVAEKTNPTNPEQVWYRGAWVDLQRSEQQIKVKGQAPVTLTLRRSPHGPIVNDALGQNAGQTPIAMWWSFLEADNPVLDGFYLANRADTLAKMRTAASKIQAPGLNIVWANAQGDIGWWAAGQLPIRPAGVNPTFILDGASGAAEKPGFQPFSANPQEENPARGYVLSANFQPVSPAGIEIPGYYNPPERGQQLDRQLSDNSLRWDLPSTRQLQLGTRTDYGPSILRPLLADLRAAAASDDERAMVEQLATWPGDYPLDSVPATLFNQFLYELANKAFKDELGDALFDTLLSTRVFDSAMPRLAASADSPWWDDRRTPGLETRADIVKAAWRASLDHLQGLHGKDPRQWQWGQAHTLTHAHPLGAQKPLDWLLNVGPFPAPGSHEVPNNLSARTGPAPWPVNYGPSTRRIIDFADPEHSLGINPVGQSGVPFDRHYADQAQGYVRGDYVPQWLSEGDVEKHAEGVLRLVPAH